jgi:hypothetical protein
MIKMAFCETLKDHACCEYCDHRREIKVEQKRVCCYKNNLSQQLFCVIEVDGCLISTAESKKCDYMLLNCEDIIIYLIELKGKDVNRALSQLESTIDVLKNERYFIEAKTVNAYAILAHKPKPAIYTKAQLKLAKKLKRMGKKGKVSVEKSSYIIP